MSQTEKTVPRTQQELTDMFEQIQMGFANIYSLFNQNFKVPEDDEDMEGLMSAMDFLSERI